jgi:DNA repair photolyase
LIVFSGDTDCYQPIEASYKLTRGCLEVCRDFGNPIGIITKSFLIMRDLELLKAINERTQLGVTVSIPFYDERTARKVEPGASSVSKRFEIVKAFSDAGINVGVNIAPVIPGLSDSDIPSILKKASECGAQRAGLTLLRLPGNVKEVFLARMKALFPMAAEKITARIREVRGGALYNSEFGKRHSGTGDYWENIEKMFDIQCEKLGLNRRYEKKSKPGFKRPTPQKEFLFTG